MSSSPAISAEHLSKLRWRSRRGTQELDLLLMRYLAQRAPLAEMSEIAEFERLLACEDRELQRWFLAYAPCPDPELSLLVDAIRALPVA